MDSITGKNSGLNLGPGSPVIHFEQWEEDEIEVRLILKGGGCENKNIQYSLPMELPKLGRADRNLEGVYKCMLHAVWQAQGQGCAPGAVGVCIGSDRAHGYLLAKYQLFRTLDDTNSNPVLAKLEAEIMDAAGCNFNPDSTKQLADVLFNKLGLKVIKRNKTGPSTDVMVLERLTTKQIIDRELATGVPLIYRLNADSTVASKLDLAA